MRGFATDDGLVDRYPLLNELTECSPFPFLAIEASISAQRIPIPDLHLPSPHRSPFP